MSEWVQSIIFRISGIDVEGRLEMHQVCCRCVAGVLQCVTNSLCRVWCSVSHGSLCQMASRNVYAYTRTHVHNMNIQKSRITCKCTNATRCNTLQHAATRCNTLKYTATQHTTTHLQVTVTCCTTLQHTATHCNTLQHTAPHCHTLQHTATHCNTPKRPMTSRNTA